MQNTILKLSLILDACAILYDHSNCRDEKVVVPIGYTKLSFRDRNDVESVLVKKGCTLTLFGDSGDDINKRGQSYIVSAAGKTEAVGKTLDDSKVCFFYPVGRGSRILWHQYLFAQFFYLLTHFVNLNTYKLNTPNNITFMGSKTLCQSE